MPEPAALFFDVGGVLLTNGWDRGSRRAAAERFGLDPDELEDRHDALVGDFEAGRLSRDAYLDLTVFCAPRSFSRASFVGFMESQSQPHRDSLRLVGELAAAGRYLLATLNNESRELNRYRIETFGLDRLFSLFFSSCYLGVAKPSRRFFEIAFDVTGRRPEECLFVDDRPQNVEAARELGLPALRYRGARELRRELAERGVVGAPGAAPALHPHPREVTT